MARPPITRANPYTPKRGKLAGITFTSERQYRNALARLKGFRSWKEQQRQVRSIRSGAEVGKLRRSEREARDRALEAIRLMRTRGLSIGKAAKEAGTTVNAVKRHAGTALKRDERGRYKPKTFDRIIRTMLVPTPNGPVLLDVRDSRTASKLGAYWSAVSQYLATGDDRALRKFRGKGVRIGGQFYPFITDPGTLRTLGGAGVLSFRSIYELRSAA